MDQEQQVQKHEADVASAVRRLADENKDARTAADAHETKKYRLEKWAIALLAVTTAATVWQAYLTRRALEDNRGGAEEQARHTRDALEISQRAANAAETAQRAWVGPTSARSDQPIVGSPLEFFIGYANTGREPGRDFRYVVGPFTELAANDEAAGTKVEYLASECLKEGSSGGGHVFPSTGFGGYTITQKLDGVTIDRSVVNGAKVIIVTGCFTYKTLGAVHHTAFCYFYDAKRRKSGDLNICLSGNKAD